LFSILFIISTKPSPAILAYERLNLKGRFGVRFDDIQRARKTYSSEATPHIGVRIGLEIVLGNDPEIGATDAKTPVEIGVERLIGVGYLPVCSHNFVVDDVVAGKSVLWREERNSA
jgi:hypothetical protein